MTHRPFCSGPPTDVMHEQYAKASVERLRYAGGEPNRELTWAGAAAWGRAVHRHLLEPVATGRTLLRSQESESAPLLGLLPSRKLQVTLHRWLHAVKTGAEQS
jgi:hypothetical protein